MSVVACLLILALGAGAVGAFMTMAEQHGPIVAGTVLIGVFTGLAILILLTLWALITLRNADQKKTAAAPQEAGPSSAHLQSAMADEVVALVQRNPLASAGVALLAGVVVSSHPELVRDILKGVEATKSKS